MGVGFKETVKMVTQESGCVVFVIHDTDHEVTLPQVMSACRIKNIPHYVLPKFAKSDLCKFLNVRRLTSFAIKCSREELCKDISKFDQLSAITSGEI